MKKGITEVQKFKLLHLAEKMKIDDLIGTLRYSKYLIINDLDQSRRSLEISIIIASELHYRIGAEKTEELSENMIQSIFKDPEGTQYEATYHILVDNYHQISAKSFNQVYVPSVFR